MRRVYVSQRVDIIDDYGERRDALDQRWASFLKQTGALMLPVPNNHEVLQRILQITPPDGILLTGGNSPKEYGGDAPERDTTDSVLLDYAIKHNIPLMGVCRGMQSVLLHFGGALEKVDAHVSVRHKVYGKINRTVNSYHKYAAIAVPPSLTVLAASEDGVIESVLHENLPIAAVMWHPEREPEFSAEDVKMISRLWEGKDYI